MESYVNVVPNKEEPSISVCTLCHINEKEQRLHWDEWKDKRTCLKHFNHAKHLSFQLTPYVSSDPVVSFNSHGLGYFSGWQSQSVYTTHTQSRCVTCSLNYVRFNNDHNQTMPYILECLCGPDLTLIPSKCIPLLLKEPSFILDLWGQGALINLTCKVGALTLGHGYWSSRKWMGNVCPDALMHWPVNQYWRNTAIALPNG